MPIGYKFLIYKGVIFYYNKFPRGVSMGLMCWLFYGILGFLFFAGLMFIQRKYTITRIEKFVFSIVFLMIASGICYRFAIKYAENIFLSFVFLMIVDIIYNSYFIESDFFDKSKRNVPYYLVLIFAGFFVNQEFINRVSQVFLTGEDLRVILWFVALLFLYSFFKDKNLFGQVSSNKKQMSSESILVQYAKLKYKYHNECHSSIADVSNILYAIMIFQNAKKGKFIRNYDYFMFRFNGNKRRLGIMQVETNKFLTDGESIDLVRKKIEKFYVSKSKTKKKVTPQEIILAYDKDNFSEIQNIFDVIQNF